MYQFLDMYHNLTKSNTLDALDLNQVLIFLHIFPCYKLTHVNLKRNPMVEIIITEYFSTHCDHTITSLLISFSGTPSPFSKTSLQNPAFFQCPRNFSTFHSSIPLIFRFLSLSLSHISHRKLPDYAFFISKS